MSLQIPMTTASTSRSAITWIASFLANTRSVANARITGYSSRDLRARIALGLVDFTITQVQLPALDTSQTRQPGVLRVEGTHRRIERLEASGQLATSTSEAWRPANFRVAIDGVDATRVIAVGPIVVERSGARNIIQPFDIIVAHDDRSWHEWAEKVLVADKPDRRNVKLELLAADRRRVLATIQLDGVAVVAASHVLSQSRTELKLSAETIKLVPASATQAIDTKVPLPPKGPAPTPTPTPTLPPR